MLLTPQYGFRSGCCYAAIKLGRKKIKNTKIKIDVWVCTKCGKRDVSLVKYTKEGGSKPNTDIPTFALDPEIEPQT